MLQISWHGHYTLKMLSNGVTIVIDPYAPSTGLAPFRAKADIVALTNPVESSMSHLDGIQGDPDVVDTPGEYSLHDITLHAMGWHSEDGSERAVHLWTLEGISVLYPGALTRELTDDELAEIQRGGIDVLIVPVGGGSGLSSKQAVQLVTTVEPRVVLPMHYKIKGAKEELEPIDEFAGAMGVDPKQTEKKAKLKASKLPQEDVETIILSPS